MRCSAANKLIVLQPALAGPGVAVQAESMAAAKRPSGKNLEIAAEKEKAGVP
jgi:hypothetical protein